MSERYKLHWVAAVVETAKTLKELIGPFIVIVFVNGFKGDSGAPWFVQYWTLLLFGAFALFTLASGIIKWRRFDYWFEEQELRIESGLFVRKKRYIPFDRIQSLDYTEGIFHRPFHLVKVRVETAGSSSGKDAEAELTAITREEAQRIEEEIQRAKNTRIIGPALMRSNEELQLGKEAAEEQAEELQQVFSMSMKDLLVLATTSGGIGVILSGAAVFLSQMEGIIPYEQLFGRLESFIRIGTLVIIVLTLLGLLFVWLLSVAMTVVANYDFKVMKSKDDLIITRGLLEKKRVTVPLNRVQNITVTENPLRQLFGYTTVIINSAGGAGESARIKLFPLAKKSRIKEPLEQLFPALDFNEPAEKIGTAGRHFYYRFKMNLALAAIIAVSYYAFPYGLLSMLILPLIYFHGRWQQKTAAFSILQKQLTMRFRTISRQTVYTKKNRIQSMEMNQNYFHRRKKAAAVTINVKSGMSVDSPAIRHMDEQQAERFLKWYEHHPEKE